MNKIKTLQKNRGLISAALVTFMFTVALLPAPNALALTPIQVLVKDQCPRSADAAERCADNFTKQLENKCGKEKNNKTYRNCARKFAVDNGAQLKSDDCWNTCEKNNNGSSNTNGSGSGTTGNTCGGVETSIISCDEDNKGNNVEDNAIWGLLLLVLNILTAGIGLVAVGGIVYGAILYTTAQDNSAQVTKAKETIFNVVLGLVMFALMYAFLQFLIPGGIFA
jgi:hypothetical protein